MNIIDIFIKLMLTTLHPIKIKAGSTGTISSAVCIFVHVIYFAADQHHEHIKAAVFLHRPVFDQDIWQSKPAQFSPKVLHIHAIMGLLRLAYLASSGINNTHK